MRGAWKPPLVFGAVYVAIMVFLSLLRGPLPWPAYAATSVAMLQIVLFASYLGAVRAGRFLRGLRDAGEVVELESDDLGWSGDRTTVVRGVQGTWRIVGTSGRHSRVDVLGPGDDLPWRVAGSSRKAARAAVERVTAGGPAAPPPRLVTPARLVVYAFGFYGVLVGVGFAIGGGTGAGWTAALLAPFFAWILWRIAERKRPILQDSSGRVLEP